MLVCILTFFYKRLHITRKRVNIEVHYFLITKVLKGNSNLYSLLLSNTEIDKKICIEKNKKR